jgi:hypothetical protein
MEKGASSREGYFEEQVVESEKQKLESGRYGLNTNGLKQPRRNEGF